MGTVLGSDCDLRSRGAQEFDEHFTDPRVEAFREKVAMVLDPDLAALRGPACPRFGPLRVTNRNVGTGTRCLSRVFTTAADQNRGQAASASPRCLLTLQPARKPRLQGVEHFLGRQQLVGHLVDLAPARAGMVAQHFEGGVAVGLEAPISRPTARLVSRPGGQRRVQIRLRCGAAGGSRRRAPAPLRRPASGGRIDRLDHETHRAMAAAWCAVSASSRPDRNMNGTEVCSLQAARQFQAGHAGHGDVEQGQVAMSASRSAIWLQRFGRPRRRCTVS